MYFFQVQIAIFWYLQVYKTSYVYLQVQSLHTSTHSYFFILASTKNKLCILGQFYKYTKQAMYTWTIFFPFPMILFHCSAWPRLKLNTKKGLNTTTTNHHPPPTTTHHHPPPTTTTTQTLRQQYLSCYWPDLDQTLNKGSWEHIQQITTVTTTFVQATFVLGTFVHISNISAVTGPIWIKL